MGDARHVGNAQRRRMGVESSHLDMAQSANHSLDEVHRAAHSGKDQSLGDCGFPDAGGCSAMTGEAVPVCHRCGEQPVPLSEPYLSDAAGEPVCKSCLTSMQKPQGGRRHDH